MYYYRPKNHDLALLMWWWCLAYIPRFIRGIQLLFNAVDPEGRRIVVEKSLFYDTFIRNLCYHTRLIEK